MTDNGTFRAALRGDKRKTPETRQYRFLTLEECRNLPHGARVPVCDDNGRIAEVKITSVKTWKTRPDVGVGWKYGLYEYGRETFTPTRENVFFVSEVDAAQ